MATASLILGIVSIVFSFFWVIAVICGILAVVLGIVAKGKIKTDANLGGSGAATGGIVTGAIGIVLSIIIIAVAVIFLGAFVDAATDGTLEEAMRNLEGLKDYQEN